MLMRCFEQEMGAATDVVFAAVHPGWVSTDMGSAGGRTADLGAEESVQGVLKLLDSLERPTHGGRLFNYTGEEMVW